MQIRVCDRCRVEVPGTSAKETVRSVTLPIELPATGGVVAPMDVTLSIVAQAPADLCPPCWVSAVLEYVAQEIKAGAPESARALAARLTKVLKG